MTSSAFKQGQIGDNFLMMAQYDKPVAMRRVLSPMLSGGTQRTAAVISSLAPFVVCGQVRTMDSALMMLDFA